MKFRKESERECVFYKKERKKEGKGLCACDVGNARAQGL